MSWNTNSCRDVHKFVPWYTDLLTFRETHGAHVVCCGIHEPMSSNILTHVVVCTNLCRGIYKVVPWYASTHVTKCTTSNGLTNSFRGICDSCCGI